MLNLEDETKPEIHEEDEEQVVLSEEDNDEEL